MKKTNLKNIIKTYYIKLSHINNSKSTSEGIYVSFGEETIHFCVNNHEDEYARAYVIGNRVVAYYQPSWQQVYIMHPKGYVLSINEVDSNNQPEPLYVYCEGTRLVVINRNNNEILFDEYLDDVDYIDDDDELPY